MTATLFESRRRVLSGIACTAATWVLPGRAAEPGAGPVRLLVGAASGSVMDVAARQIGESFAAQTGLTAIVDNRPSAGGIVALDALRQAPPDGQTLGFVYATQMSAAPGLFPRLPYDPLLDFAPVGILFRGPQVLVLQPTLGVARWPELLRLLQAQPGRYRYSTPGNGTPQHLTMEQIKAAAGVDVQHIPYRGPAATAAVLSGEVDMTLEGVMPMLPHLRAGKLRAVALGGPQRVPALADVPTFEELGVPGIGTVWVGLVAPKGTPAEVVRRLNAEWSRAVRAPAVQGAFEATGRVVAPGSPAEMATTIAGEIPVWRALVQRARISTE